MRRLQKNRFTFFVTLTLVVFFFAAWWIFLKNSSIPTKEDSLTTAQGQTIELNPATPEEKEETESHKDRLASQIDAQSSNSINSAKKVTPVITYATEEQVDAFVPDVYENGGACTLVATKGSSQFTKQVAAFADATTTQCEHFVLKPSNFSSKGTWSVKIRYSSSTTTGESEARLLEVN